MKIHCTYDKLVLIGELKLHPKNRNVHPDDQIKRLAEILKYQGWRYPIKVSKRSGFVTSGHGRIEAARLNKWAEIPVNFQEYETEAQEFADLTADNAIASWSALDEAAILQDYKSFEMELDFNLLGLKEVEIKEPNIEGQCDADDVPQTPNDLPRTRSGDLYTLGNHRLLCGDSTKREDVERLMNGEKADMVFTDPPYGISYDESKYSNTDGYNGAVTNKRKIIEGDEKQFDATYLLEVCAKSKEAFIWGANNFCQQIPMGGSWVCWEKKNENQTNLLNGDFELAWSQKPHKYKMIRVLWGGFLNKEKGETRMHPTQKPVSLAVQCFELWGRETSSVLDLFLGSGSTLIACEKTNRRCYGMEIDPHYCDIIVSRYCKFTGKNKIKINGNEIEWDMGITKPVQ